MNSSPTGAGYLVAPARLATAFAAVCVGAAALAVVRRPDDPFARDVVLAAVVVSFGQAVGVLPGWINPRRAGTQFLFGWRWFALFIPFYVASNYRSLQHGLATGFAAGLTLLGGVNIVLGLLDRTAKT